MQCRICQSPKAFFSRATVLGRHDVCFTRCGGCNFIQIEEPFWLEEAYTSAVTCSDVGMVARNMWFVKIARSVIEFFSNRRGKFLDYGGGAGLFTRLMRDAGYDFSWYDRHCQNLYAGPFVADVSGEAHYELLTAVEVFEHITDPLVTIGEMAALSSNILFTTQLVPNPPPPIDDWWYYGIEHGQHLSFYTRQSLSVIAEKLGLHLMTNGRNLHMFSRKLHPPAAFRVATSLPIASLMALLVRRPSLLPVDFRATRTGAEVEDADRP